MKRLFNLFLLLNFVVLVGCAASYPKQALMNCELPEYKGYITPITIPIRPSYKPSSYEINIRNAERSSQNSTNKITEDKATIRVQVDKFGESLIWDFSLKKLVMQWENQELNFPDSSIPYLNSRLLTDKLGKIGEMETSSPFLEKHNVPKEAIDIFIKSEEPLIPLLIPILSNIDITSGDVLSTIDLMKIFKQAYRGQLAIVASERKDLSDDMRDEYINKSVQEMEQDPWSNIQVEAKFIVEGYCYVNNKKYILATLDYVNAVSNTTMSGYSIIDPNTFISIKSEVMTIKKENNVPISFLITTTEIF